MREGRNLRVVLLGRHGEPVKGKADGGDGGRCALHR